MITQPVKILTDVEQTYSIVCPITAVLAPSKPFMILKPDFTLLSLDGNATSQSDIGIHTFTLTVSFPNFVSVAAVTYSFKADLQLCVVSSFAFTATIANMSYKVNQGPITTGQF